MVVRSIGNSLLVILPDLVGKKITNWFDLVRPLIAFKFQTVSRKIGFKPHDNVRNAKKNKNCGNAVLHFNHKPLEN